MNDELKIKNNELGGKMNYRYRNDEEMKDSGVEWIGKIPKEWSIVNGKYLFKNKKLKNSGGLNNILSLTLNGVIDRDKNNFEGLQPESFDGYQEFNNDNLVFKLIDLENINTSRVGYVHKDGLMSPAYIRLEKNKDIHVKYYYYNYFDYYNQKIYNFLGSVGVRSALNSSDLVEMDVINNKLIEQEKIAKFLDEKTAQFDSIISKKEALIEKLEEAKKSLISEVVTGKVKVVKTNDGYELVERKKEEMKDSGVEWLGDIPIEWDISKLKYIGESITGLTYSPKDIVDENKGILVLRSSNVQNGKIVFEDNVYVDMNIPDKLITKIGDIIICSRNGSRALIGKNACIREEQQGMSFGAFMTIFRSRYFEYLNFVFNSEIFKAQSGSFLTSTINQLTISNLNSFIIPLPNFKEQNIVVMYLREKISEYDKILDNIKMQIEKLKEAKQSLISEAVTGKIEILD